MKTSYPELNLALDWESIVCENPKAFTADQIEDYNENGYVTGIQLFEGDRLKEVQEWFEASKERLTTYDGPFVSYHHQIPELYDVVTNTRTVAYLNDLLGPNVVCHVSQYIRKEPEPDSERMTIAHQDSTFNPMDARCALVWLAIDRAVTENGCMWFVPGSHKLGTLECGESNHHIEEIERYGEAVPIELEPGQAAIFSDLVIHTSPPNRTADTVRGGLTATYAAVELVPTLGPKTWAVLCSGEDSDDNWQVHPRPRVSA